MDTEIKSTDTLKQLLPWASVIAMIVGAIIWFATRGSQIGHNKDAITAIDQKIDGLIQSESNYQMTVTDRLARIETKLDTLNED